MSDILIKYNRLNKTAKKEVTDFMDFLLSKQKAIKNKISSSYKTKILKVSSWSEDDIRLITENQKQFNSWNIQEW
jgi:hypothetical protein